MRAVIVTGDRYAESMTWYPVVFPHLTDIEVVIAGGAPGIDSIADQARRDYIGSGVIAVPALWDKHGGRAAGPRRNAAMLKILLTLQEHGYTVGVIAFHDNLAESKGTRNMTEIAREAGVPVVLYRSDGTREVLK